MTVLSGIYDRFVRCFVVNSGHIVRCFGGDGQAVHITVAMPPPTLPRLRQGDVPVRLRGQERAADLTLSRRRTLRYRCLPDPERVLTEPHVLKRGEDKNEFVAVANPWVCTQRPYPRELVEDVVVAHDALLPSITRARVLMCEWL
jgi:hypothetical protein